MSDFNYVNRVLKTKKILNTKIYSGSSTVGVSYCYYVANSTYLLIMVGGEDLKISD